jgi:hypothetical protein
MPTYPYKCICGWSGDLLVGFEDRDKAVCPECHRLLARMPHYDSLQVSIPRRFIEQTGPSPLDRPNNAETAKTWEEDGVRLCSDKGRWM